MYYTGIDLHKKTSFLTTIAQDLTLSFRPHFYESDDNRRNQLEF